MSYQGAEIAIVDQMTINSWHLMTFENNFIHRLYSFDYIIFYTNWRNGANIKYKPDIVIIKCITFLMKKKF